MVEEKQVEIQNIEDEYKDKINKLKTELLSNNSKTETELQNLTGKFKSEVNVTIENVFSKK